MDNFDVAAKLRCPVFPGRNRQHCLGDFEATRAYIEQCGKPQAFYSDKYSD